MQKILILLFITFISLFANETIELKNNNLDKFKISYLKDKDSSLNIDEVSKANFENISKNNFNLGYFDGTIWFKFTIQNSSDYEDFVMSLNETFYEKANLFYEENGKWQNQSNSLFTLVENRKIKSNKLAFETILKKDETKTFYLQLYGKYAYFGKITLFEEQLFYLNESKSVNLFFTFVLGIVVIFIFFTLFLYKITKEKIYLYYLIYSIFLSIYFSNITGLLVFVNLQEYIYKIQLTASFMVGFLILFSKEYLQTSKYLKRVDKILSILSVPFFVFGILVVFSYQPWNKVINNFSGLICLLLIVVSIIVYFKGHNQTKYYIFAMVIYFTSVVIFTFMVNGTFEYTFFTRYGFTFAIVVEMLLFSYLLANRYYLMKEDMQKYLENEVSNRTKELKILLKERELLLREVYHRVKNNFHMLIGMLHLEDMKESQNKDFQGLVNRVKSMSLIHEYLYKSDNLSNISIKTYLEKIIFNIRISYPKIKIDSQIEDITIDFENALSLGIITNEILTNAVKHNKKDDFSIEIRLFRKGEENILLIQDNGKGFDNKDKKANGLGLKLVDQFSKKLDSGKYQFWVKNGTKFELSFKNNEEDSEK